MVDDIYMVNFTVLEVKIDHSIEKDISKIILFL